MDACGCRRLAVTPYSFLESGVNAIEGAVGSKPLPFIASGMPGYPVMGVCVDCATVEALVGEALEWDR
jgi:hypothetical protein